MTFRTRVITGVIALGLVLVLILVLLLDGEPTTTPTPTPTITLTQMPTITPTTEQGVSEVFIDEVPRFSPQILTVPVGTTVTWRNYDFEYHSVTSDTNLFDADLSPDNFFRYTFTESGVFKYHCQYLDDMFGWVIAE